MIVTLGPTTAANALAAQSQLSPRMRKRLNGHGAPTYYDLQNPDLRNGLRATVTARVDQVIAQLAVPGLTVTHRFSYQFGFAARVTPAALALLAAHPAVIRIEQDAELTAHLKQGIPLMGASLPRSTYNGSGVSIAICDSGIDTSHPMLGGNGTRGTTPFNAKVIGGYDVVPPGNPDPRPDSVYGNSHGTAVAGIAAGNLGTAGDYIGGVAPAAKLYAIKIAYGTSLSTDTAAMIAGWEWAIQHQNDDPANPILVINTSFGGLRYSTTSDCESFQPAMTAAAANAVAAGITIFASSGNDGYCDSMAWPACISYVNSVGAVYDADIAPGNRMGWCVAATSCASQQVYFKCDPGYYTAIEVTAADKVTVYSNTASFLTLLAPSHNAYTTDIVGSGGSSSGDYDPTFGGTSAASPYAAGAAAVLQSAAKDKTGAFLTPDQVRQYLTANGDAITDTKVAMTTPRINLARAVDALPPAAPSNLSTTVASPSQIDLSWTDNSTDETGFRIERKTGVAGPWAEITATAANATSYPDAGLTPATAYYYRVSAYHATGTSGYTNESTVTTPATTYTLTVTQSGTGNGTIGGGGTFPYQTLVTPIASAASDSGFGGWAPGSCATAFALIADTTCTATFTLKNYAITTSASPAGGGTANCTPNPADFDGTSTCRATPTAGYTFSAWSGDCIGASCVLSNVTAAKAVTATFTRNSYAIAATASPAAGGTASCTPNPADYDGTSTCSATPTA
ncbi:S8 family serine peptidase, partial [uncultured Thiodictyon sp.]|uniref:S8 family serine peptidase n=1 Tax=uncultured Thiodictyon sp. TaxID=1846217 RepID=UPI0025ED8FD1